MSPFTRLADSLRVAAATSDLVRESPRPLQRVQYCLQKRDDPDRMWG